MSIIPNPEANFTPPLKGYSGQGAFRFWCQTALPLVYDDSLSYYELLNKVVNYLNNAISDISNMGENVQGLHDAYVRLQDYVNNYFSTLDVQEEIDNKLDEMADNGTLTTLITPFLPAIIAAWLSEHITPTSPPLDDTFTVPNTAALSTAVGKYCLNSSAKITIHSGETTYTSADAFPEQSIVGIGIDVSENDVQNLPTYGSSAICYTLTNAAGVSGNVKNQLYIARGHLYSRVYSANSWSDWTEIANKSMVDSCSENSVSSYLNITITDTNYMDNADADNFPLNKIIGISQAVTADMVSNLPEYGARAVCVTMTQIISTDSNLRLQFYVTKRTFYWRVYGASEWGEWVKVTTTEDAAKIISTSVSSSEEITITSSNYSNYPDANTFPYNKIVALAQTVTSDMVANMPEYGVRGVCVGFTQNVRTSSNLRLQIYANKTNFYWRTFAAGSWGAWVKVNTGIEPVDNIEKYFVHTCVDKPITLRDKGLYIFGDSITTKTHGGFTWGSLVAEATGCTEHNFGVGSSAFVHNNYETLRVIDQINGVTNWSECDVIIVAAGTNDANYNTTSTALRDAVTLVINTLKSNAPNAKIIFITPIQRAQENYNAVLPMIAGCICNIALANGCSVINGFDIPIPCYSNEWIDDLTDNDGLHPNSTGKRVYARAVINAIM